MPGRVGMRGFLSGCTSGGECPEGTSYSPRGKDTQNGRTTASGPRHEVSASPSTAVIHSLSSTLLPISKHRPSHEPSQEVFPAGRGTTYSKAVTRCRSACTGQALGRWRRRRSLYCLTCVAILKRVTMIVAGWACASAVRYGVKWRSVRHGGGHTQHTRAATGGHGPGRWWPRCGRCAGPP